LILEYEIFFKLSFLFSTFFFFTVNAQVQALFNSKRNLEIYDGKMGTGLHFSEGNLLITPTSLFCLRWTNNLNERPESGNTDPDL
jgi:phospholipase A1